MRKPPFGTADAEVLVKFTSHPAIHRGTWSKQDGITLYESRALTEAICQKLVRQGYMKATVKPDSTVVYSLTKAGRDKALELGGYR